MMDKVTLQKGDYVATADIKNEAEYRSIAWAFEKAGANICTARNGNMQRAMLGQVHHIGWDSQDNKLFHMEATNPMEAGMSRQLTPAQILATPQWGPEVGERALVNNDPGYHIEYGENVIGKEVEVKALFKSGDIDVAAVEHDGACYCFRVEMLSELTTEEDRAVEEMLTQVRYQNAGLNGSELAKIVCQAAIKAGYRKQPTLAEEIYFNDPDNWRAGDLALCIDEGSTRNRRDLFTNGKKYEIMENDGTLSFGYKANDGERHYADNICFRFHSRP